MRACTVTQSLQHRDQVHLQLEVPLGTQISLFQSRCVHLISTWGCLRIRIPPPKKKSIWSYFWQLCYPDTSLKRSRPIFISNFPTLKPHRKLRCESIRKTIHGSLVRSSASLALFLRVWLSLWRCIWRKQLCHIQMVNVQKCTPNARR